MNKLTLNLETGKHFVYLERFISTKYGAKIQVKNIGILWKFKNVLTGANDTITGVTFEEGYWSFNMISEKLAENNIQFERNRYDNTCAESDKSFTLWLLLRFSCEHDHTGKHVDELTV